MNRKDRKARAERLSDAIGGIDDRYLDEAMHWAGSSLSVRRRPRAHLLLPAAAALVLVLALAGTAVLTMQRKDDTPSNSAPGQSAGSHGQAALDSLLLSCTGSNAFTPVGVSGPDFFDGTVRLVVENRQTGERFVSRPLTDTEQRLLRAEFAVSGTPVDAGEPEPDCLVWVLLGDGTVVSPCLNPSAGNVGAAVLFDYSPERLPSDIFTDLLTGMQ